VPSGSGLTDPAAAPRRRGRPTTARRLATLRALPGMITRAVEPPGDGEPAEALMGHDTRDRRSSACWA